jgi:alkanesulfonate monooxygenase SsuD/methylene tetrahydromethanopterin reductase-like flavin-dependent oxidoreductase (luciferase family)
MERRDRPRRECVLCAVSSPVLTARLAADLDNLSDGRLILGLGNGWDANGQPNLGLPFLPPVMIAGAGERFTLRQVARSADACNIMHTDPLGGGLLSPEAVANKLAVLRGHCDDFGKPFDTVLRTYTTGWTILGQEEAALQAKLAHCFPEGIEQRYQGQVSA